MNFKLSLPEVEQIIAFFSKRPYVKTPIKNGQRVYITGEITLIDANKQVVLISEGEATLVKSTIAGKSPLNPDQNTAVAYFTVKGTRGLAPWGYWQSLIDSGKVKVL